MYCGSIDLTKLQSREILNLLLLSDEFELQTLVTYSTLIKNHVDFIIKNILEIIESTNASYQVMGFLYSGNLL